MRQILAERKTENLMTKKYTAKKNVPKHTKKKSFAIPSGVARIGDILPQFLARYGLHRQEARSQLREAWQQTVGEKISGVTRVGNKKRGTLEVFVPHQAYAQELGFREQEFVAALEKLVPHEKITRIRFRVMENFQ